MMEYHNAKERDMADWRTLLENTDPRFSIVDVTQPNGSRLSIIEAAWLDGNDSSLD